MSYYLFVGQSSSYGFKFEKNKEYDKDFKAKGCDYTVEELVRDHPFDWSGPIREAVPGLDVPDGDINTLSAGNGISFTNYDKVGYTFTDITKEKFIKEASISAMHLFNKSILNIGEKDVEKLYDVCEMMWEEFNKRGY